MPDARDLLVGGALDSYCEDAEERLESLVMVANEASGLRFQLANGTLKSDLSMILVSCVVLHRSAQRAVARGCCGLLPDYCVLTTCYTCVVVSYRWRPAIGPISWPGSTTK